MDSDLSIIHNTNARFSLVRSSPRCSPSRTGSPAVSSPASSPGQPSGSSLCQVIPTSHWSIQIKWPLNSLWLAKNWSFNARCINIILIRQLRFCAELDPGSPDWISDPLHPKVPSLCPCHFPLLERIQVKSQYLSSSGSQFQFLETLVKFIDHLFQALVMGPGIRIQDCRPLQVWLDCLRHHHDHSRHCCCVVIC